MRNELQKKKSSIWKNNSIIKVNNSYNLLSTYFRMGTNDINNLGDSDQSLVCSVAYDNPAVNPFWCVKGSSGIHTRAYSLQPAMCSPFLCHDNECANAPPEINRIGNIYYSFQNLSMRLHRVQCRHSGTL